MSIELESAARLTALKQGIEAKTGETYADLTEGVNALIEGFGSGEELVITDFYYFHYENLRLDLLGKYDTSKGTNFGHMFYNCNKLTTVPELDVSNGTNFGHMFYNCGWLRTVPELDVSNGTSFNCMFYNCGSLTTVPELDVSKGTDFGHMFYNCGSLTTVPELDTSNGTAFASMFNICKKLTTVPELDVSNGTSFDNMFRQCKELTNLYLYNIKNTIQIGSGASWGHLLTVESLVHTIKELCTATSSQTLTIGSANLEKIAGLYCRITDATHEKKTMELCESTDEGAMTLSDYASEKNWLIQ
jgi:hypothetical protein